MPVVTRRDIMSFHTIFGSTLSYNLRFQSPTVRMEGENLKNNQDTFHIFLQPNLTDRSSDGKKEEQFFIPKFHVDYNEVD